MGDLLTITRRGKTKSAKPDSNRWPTQAQKPKKFHFCQVYRVACTLFCAVFSPIWCCRAGRSFLGPYFFFLLSHITRTGLGYIMTSYDCSVWSTRCRWSVVRNSVPCLWARPVASGASGSSPGGTLSPTLSFHLWTDNNWYYFVMS